jgi:hypothetical protein
MLFSAIAVGGAGGALWLMQSSALAEQAKPAETQFPEGPFERGVSSGTAVLAASASATEELRDCTLFRARFLFKRSDVAKHASLKERIWITYKVCRIACQYLPTSITGARRAGWCL